MSKRMRLSDLVYSTEVGRTCPECQQAINDCRCDQDVIPEGDGFVRISLDRKGRKGKGMTILNGIPLNEKDLKALAKELKQKCGVGGSVKDHEIEIQGDQRELLIPILEKKGYKVKRVGG